MRRRTRADLSLGTVKERNGPESLTRCVAGPPAATCSVDRHAAAPDQVRHRPATTRLTPHLLIARVESEAAKSQAIRIPVSRVPGAMQHAALRGVLLRRTGTATGAGVRDGPGSAVHRFRSEEHTS